MKDHDPAVETMESLTDFYLSVVHGRDDLTMKQILDMPVRRFVSYFAPRGLRFEAVPCEPLQPLPEEETEPTGTGPFVIVSENRPPYKGMNDYLVQVIGDKGRQRSEWSSSVNKAMRFSTFAVAESFIDQVDPRPADEGHCEPEVLDTRRMGEGTTSQRDKDEEPKKEVWVIRALPRHPATHKPLYFLWIAGGISKWATTPREASTFVDDITAHGAKAYTKGNPPPKGYYRPKVVKVEV
jgi:hypothetical protein